MKAELFLCAIGHRIGQPETTIWMQRTLEWSPAAHTVTVVILVKFDMTDHSTAPASPPADARKDTWTLANAKARLSEVVDRAQTGPQIITRYGRPDAVIVSAEEWARKTARNTLAEFLLASPLRGAELKLERAHDEPRDAMP